MRGKVFPIHDKQWDIGITPAYAGKSGPLYDDNGIPRDHPRVCGEKDPLELDHPHPGGITPAYAGKSSRQSTHSRLSRDHPRVCGEKCAYVARYITKKGSPPRMRGKV